MMDAWSDWAGQKMRLEVPTHQDRPSDSPPFATREGPVCGARSLNCGGFDEMGSTSHENCQST